MNGLNEAFERLREHVPGVNNQTDKKLSKTDTLQMANIYIRHLVDLKSGQGDILFGMNSCYFPFVFISGVF